MALTSLAKLYIHFLLDYATYFIFGPFRHFAKGL